MTPTPTLLIVSVTGWVTQSKAEPIVSSNMVDSNQYTEASKTPGSPPVYSSIVLQSTVNSRTWRL
jgi:hypothetical protein